MREMQRNSGGMKEPLVPRWRGYAVWWVMESLGLTFHSGEEGTSRCEAAPLRRFHSCLEVQLGPGKMKKEYIWSAHEQFSKIGGHNFC